MSLYLCPFCKKKTFNGDYDHSFIFIKDLNEVRCTGVK